MKMGNIKKPLIGITSGDPSGIGPEVVVKALAKKEIYDICRPLVISDFGLMKDAVRVAGEKLELNRIEGDLDSGRYELGFINVLDMHNVDMLKHVYKKVSAENGKASLNI